MASATPVPTMYSSKEQSSVFTAKTYHGLNILVDSTVIGRIQSWNPSAHQRTVTHKWELSKANFGRPIDLVPSKSDGYSISMSRLDVWESELERVLGYGAVWSDLIDQNYPITLTEVLYRGADSIYTSWDYPSCWFSNYQVSEYGAEGDGYVTVNADVAHLPRVKTA